MKRVKVLLSILLIICTLIINIQAAAGVAFRFEPQALKLYQLGLFTGTSSTSFKPDLGAVLNRQLGVTLLLNLFGKKNNVLSMQTTEVSNILSKYTDQTSIANWARPYMAYAIKTGLFVGTSSNKLSPLQSLSGVAYATMLLRLLGYKIDGMMYLSSLQILNEKGGLNKPVIDYFNKQQFIKDDAIGLTYSALFASCSSGESLIERLVNEGTAKLSKDVPLDLMEYIQSASRGGDRPDAYDKVYNLILEAMLNGTASITVPRNEYTDTLQEVIDIVDICREENPDILYYEKCLYKSTGLLTIDYGATSETVRNNTAALFRKINILAEILILPGMTDYQKELAVHDFIVEHCDYDIEGYESGNIPAVSFSAYGALCLGKAVCEGYAEAASLLLERAGMESKIVYGTSGGVKHAWNQVKVGGKYYHLDITSDDPVMTDGSKVLLYHYFNLADSDISVDHQWKKSDYPACTARDYEYYSYNNMTVKSYDEFVRAVVEKVQKGERNIALKVEAYKTIGFDIGNAVQDISTKLKKGFTYSFSHEFGIAELSFD